MAGPVQQNPGFQWEEGAGELQRSWLRREACVCGSAVVPPASGVSVCGEWEKTQCGGSAGHRASAGGPSSVFP